MGTLRLQEAVQAVQLESPRMTGWTLQLEQTVSYTTSADLLEPAVHMKIAFGSMIVPASWQGLYSIRPTHGLLDQAGVVPHSR